MDQNVGIPGQAPNNFGSAWVGKINTDTTFVPVVAEIGAGLTVPQRGKSPNVIASIRAFDLNDVSPEVAEQLGAIGTSDILRQIDDGNSVQRHHLFKDPGGDGDAAVALLDSPADDPSGVATDQEPVNAGAGLADRRASLVEMITRVRKAA